MSQRASGTVLRGGKRRSYSTGSTSAFSVFIVALQGSDTGEIGFFHKT